MDDEEIETKDKKEPVCPRCGLRSYDTLCQNCGTPIIANKEDDEEEYDWREHKR